MAVGHAVGARDMVGVAEYVVLKARYFQKTRQITFLSFFWWIFFLNFGGF